MAIINDIMERSNDDIYGGACSSFDFVTRLCLDKPEKYCDGCASNYLPSYPIYKRNKNGYIQIQHIERSIT